MTRGRLPLLVAGTAVIAAALAGCTKPAPGVSVFSGTTTEYRPAACWSFDGTGVDAAQCASDLLAEAADGGSVARIPVVPGSVVGISVDPVVADAGWTPRIGSQPLTAEPLNTTYWRFTFPEFQQLTADGVPMEIIAGTGGTTQGVWIYQIVPASE